MARKPTGSLIAHLIRVYPAAAIVLFGTVLDLIAFSPLPRSFFERHPHLHEFWTHVAIAIVVAGLVGLFIEFTHIRTYIEEQLRGIVLGSDVLERLNSKSLSELRGRVLEAELTRYLDRNGAGLSELIQSSVMEKLRLPYQKNMRLKHVLKRVPGADIIHYEQIRSYALVPPRDEPELSFPSSKEEGRGFLSCEAIPQTELTAHGITQQFESITFEFNGEPKGITPTERRYEAEGVPQITYEWTYPSSTSLGEASIETRLTCHLRPWDVEFFVTLVRMHTLGLTLEVHHDGDFAQGYITGLERATAEDTGKQSGLARTLVVSYPGWLLRNHSACWNCRYTHSRRV